MKATYTRTNTMLSMMVCALMVLMAPLAHAQVSEAQFKAAQKAQADLSQQIQTITANMSQAQTSGDLDEYNRLKGEYERLAVDIGKQKKTIQTYMAANKELTNVMKLYNNGQEKLRLNQPDAAMQMYNQCIASAKKVNNAALNETVAKAYYGLGYVSTVKKKQTGKALEYYKKALEFDANNGKTYFGIGNAERKLGNKDAAIAAYSKAIELNVMDHGSRLNLGITYMEQKKFKEAEATFYKIVEMDPKNSSAFYYLGRVLADQRRYQEAQGALEQATKLSAKNHYAFMYLAKCYNATGNLQGAILAGQGALKARRGFGGAYIEIGTAYKKMRNEAKAIENFKLATRDRTWRDQGNYELQMIEFEKQGQ
jgi:RAQPRD family integrative conjugative element protein